jgi:hypothetical protein
VALSDAPDTVNLGSRSRLELDRGVTNGGLTLQPEARAVGDFEAAGNARLHPRATLQGDLRLGGSLILEAGASVTGSVQEHATVPRRDFPSAESVATQAGSFGALGADLVVAADASTEVGDVTQQVRRLVVEAKGTLIVSGQARLEVLERLAIAPKANVVVRAGGSLTLLLRGDGQVGASARVEQQGQDRAIGLRLFVAGTGKLGFDANSSFGPGLIYYPSRVQGQAALRVSAATGAIVCGQLTTTPAAVLQLNTRYLRCALDATAPRVVITSPRVAQTVPPTQTTVEVRGSVEDDGAVEQLELTDAAGTRALSLDATGGFSTSASLRQDGEPTQICVRAVDCAGRVALECRNVEVDLPLDFAITNPPYGQRVESATIDLQGHVTRGQLGSVTAAGVSGSVSGVSFTVPNVPLAQGWNIIQVVGAGSGGASKTLRTAIARDTLPVRRGTLTVIGNTRVELEGLAETIPQNRDPLPAAGFVHYQLLDQNGRVLFLGRVLNTGMRSFHNEGLLAVPLESNVQPETGIAFYIPSLPDAREVVFTNPFGAFLGRGGLP